MTLKTGTLCVQNAEKCWKMLTTNLGKAYGGQMFWKFWNPIEIRQLAKVWKFSDSMSNHLQWLNPLNILSFFFIQDSEFRSFLGELRKTSFAFEIVWPLEILSYFFTLQSLTTSKMRKFQAMKLSQLHQAKITGLIFF